MLLGPTLLNGDGLLDSVHEYLRAELIATKALWFTRHLNGMDRKADSFVILTTFLKSVFFLKFEAFPLNYSSTPSPRKGLKHQVLLFVIF